MGIAPLGIGPARGVLPKEYPFFFSYFESDRSFLDVYDIEIID